MTDRLARNKKNAIAFYDLMFDQCEPGAAIEQFAGAEYIQHNPHVAEGKAAFVEYFERMAADLETRFALSAAPPPLDAAIPLYVHRGHC